MRVATHACHGSDILVGAFSYALTYLYCECAQIWSPSYLFFMAGSCGFVLMLLYVVYDLPANPLDPSYVPFWKRFLRRFFEVRNFDSK